MKRILLTLALLFTALSAWSQESAPTKPSAHPGVTIPHYYAIPDEADWQGLKNDTKLFITYQFAVIGVIFFLPEDISKWSREDKRANPLKQYGDNITKIEWDSDEWEINYIGHPYFGAAYYTRARNRGFDRGAAFWYSAMLSSFYEFGPEALFEEPSIQDIFVTPIAGAILGEYFMIAREKIRQRIETTGKISSFDRWALILTDPVGALTERRVELFGQRAVLDIAPIINHRTLSLNPKLLANKLNHSAQEQPEFGVQLQLRW